MRQKLVRVLTVLSLAAFGLIPASTSASAALCTPVLSSRVPGPSFVSKYGNNLTTVASINGITPAELRTRLNDSTYWIDECGRSFYQEPIDTATAAPAVKAAPYPYDQTFLLHSRPTATKVIYLDFNGHTLSGTAWNSSYNAGADIIAPGLSIDGDYATFNTNEMDVIQSIWAAVAEDYSAFDVDVTTQEPIASDITFSGTGDTRFGTRALITDDTLMYNQCACGGNAYVGVFNYSANHALYQPALIFTQGLGGPASAKNIAEAAAHEVGHNLGLSHDGTTTGSTYYTGAAGWAPIMGIGYYEPVSQWSKGEYTSANQKQDDYAVMATYGIALRVDDWGSTSATAGVLTSSASGVISTQTDSDWFKFTPTVAGSYTFSATPSVVSPNLDIRMDFYTGTRLTTTVSPVFAKVDALTATGMDASLTTNLVANTVYYLKIDGVASTAVASGGNTDYGSRGQFTVSAKFNPPVLGISTTTLASAGLNTSYSATITAVNGSGGNVFSLTTGSLPTGLSMSSAGVITGVATQIGTSSFVVQVRDSSGATASKALSIAVTPAPPTVTTTTLPPASTTQAYSTTLTGTGAGLLTWTATGVPVGLTLSTSGVLSGTPTTVATYSMVVTVTDASSGLKGTKTFSIPVTAPLTITTASLAAGRTTANYTVQMAASGGTTTRTWSATGIPAGLTFSTAGKFGGRPTVKGTFAITFTVRDSVGRTGTKTLNLTVA